MMGSDEEQSQQDARELRSNASKRLVDYVVICGLDLNNGLEPDAQGEQLQVTPLERCYKSQALLHFPDIVEGHPIEPNSVNMLCLPSGLTFLTQKKMKTLESNTWFHTFIVTREDGSRSYGHALLFYEEVADRDVCTALHTLQQMYLAELNESRAQNSGIISRSLPRSFRLLSPKLATKKVHNEPAGALYDPNKDVLYVTKAICLVSAVPIVSVAKVILQSWYRMISASESPPLPYECYLFNVLYEIPMPDRGKSIQLCYLYDDIVFQQPGTMELPHFDYSFRELILLLGVDNLLQLFTSVLFENQVLLCASDYYKLMLVAECVTALLFPFQWQYVYVPVLPTQLHNFLDAPVPYIMGLCTAGHSPEMMANIVPGEANLCLVDLDNKWVKVPEELPSFPHRQEVRNELTDILINKFKLPLQGAKSENEFSLPTTVIMAPTDEPKTPSTPDREKKRRSSKKHSLPFLDISVDTEKLNIRERASFSGILPTPQNLSQHTDVFHRVQAVAKMVVDTPDNLRKARKKSTGNTDDQLPLRSPPVTAGGRPSNSAVEDLSINNAIRELFLNRFLSMFHGYEQFVVTQAPQRSASPRPDLSDKWMPTDRDAAPLQNFDKTSFLSDQPQQHLAFLSKFIETQMFTSFIDSKVVQATESRTDEPEAARDSTNSRFVTIFDTRIKAFKEQIGSDFNRYVKCETFMQSFKPIELRLSCPDVVLGAPKGIKGHMMCSQHKQGAFQHWTLNKGYLNGSKPTQYARRRSSSERVERDAEDGHLTAQQQRRRSSKQRILQENSSAALIAQSNWKFVEQLLTECNQKTKRMCVEKMGHAEAVELGHKRARDSCDTSTIEENTLIAGLCDLLERIWSHGLQTKQGKSAVWAHLQNFLEIEDGKQTGKTVEANYLSPVQQKPRSVPATPLSTLNGKTNNRYRLQADDQPIGEENSKIFDLYEYIMSKTEWAFGKKTERIGDLSSATDLTTDPNAGRQYSTLESLTVPKSLFGSATGSGGNNRDSRDKRRNSANRTASSSAPPRRHSATPRLGDPMAPLATALANDIRFVHAMEEVKTDIGFARAWVRLSLEKKCLSRHIKTLLANQELLRNLYKRHAFLRSDDEKEYFLHYLLTLNAIDYACFTHTYTNAVIPYRVTIFPSKRLHANTTSANIWVTVSGTLAQTEKPLNMPKPGMEMVFKASNLGMLTTLRLGHDSSGLAPKILIENVLVRNEVTGQCYKFPCGRWLGKGVDDSATERLLIAEAVPLGTPESEIYDSCKLPTVSLSPAVASRQADIVYDPQEVQQALSNAVNNIVKHHFRHVSERTNLTLLLCKEYGLVFALEQVFLFGFKAVRLFRHLYLWDFFVKVKMFFENFLEENEAVLDAKRRDEHLNVMNGYICIVDKIEAAATNTVGKDQRFQAFICLAVREHFLHRMLVHVASAPVTTALYEENSFLRDSSLLSFLVQVLENLVQVDFSNMEKSIILNVV